MNFDAAVEDMLLAFASGATLVLMREPTIGAEA